MTKLQEGGAGSARRVAASESSVSKAAVACNQSVQTCCPGVRKKKMEKKKKKLQALASQQV